MKRVVAAQVLLLLIVGHTVAIAPSAGAVVTPIVGFGTVYGGIYSSVWEMGADAAALNAATGQSVTFLGTFHDADQDPADYVSGEYSNTKTILDQAWAGQATPFANFSIPATAAAIASGAWDTKIRRFASHVEGFLDQGGGRSLILAPLQEMNGDWTLYGCQPASYEAAYIRIYDIFRDRGLDETQVRFAFAPNGWTSPGCGSIADYYPGDSYVDVNAFSAYNFGANTAAYCVDTAVGWETVSHAMTTGVEALRAIAPLKPIIVAQTAAPRSGCGATTANGGQDQWVRDLFAFAAADPNIVGIIWFNYNNGPTGPSDVHNETDWRIWDGVTVTQGWIDGMNLDADGLRTDYQWPLTNWFQPGPLVFRQYPEMCDRLSGLNRYATAAAISADTFSPGVPVAYVATGLGFADALAAAAAGGALGGPVLLVPGTSVPSETLAELQRLDPARIVVAGGINAVSDSVVTTLNDDVAPTDRIGGLNRYHTAALIAQDAFDAPVPIAYVATGLNFPDALAAAAAAGAQGGPVLLTRLGDLPGETRDALVALAPDKIVVVGGINAVSTAVEDELRTIQSNLERIAGSDRYDTAARLAAFAEFPDTVFVATGLGFADALAGAAAAGSIGVPLLLTTRDAVPGPTSAKLAGFNPNPTRCVALGGTSVISDYVSWQLRLAADAAPH